MPRLQVLLEAVARAVNDHALGELRETGVLRESLWHVADVLARRSAKVLSNDVIRESFQEIVSIPPDTLDFIVRDAVTDTVPSATSESRELLVRYLQVLSTTISQRLRRPADDHGSTVPSQLTVSKPDDWLPFLPVFLPRFRDDDRPELLDNWQVRELRGLGVGCETWRGWDDVDPHTSPACLKFVCDPVLRHDFSKWERHFLRILDLEPMSGIVTLRSVYMLTDPPCLESTYVTGHDLTGLINDWRWRYNSTRPGQAVMIVRRIARAVGALHQLGPPIVHRGLKPSNILIQPTAEGKASIWVSDIGWGAISSGYALQRGDSPEARRHALRGAYAPLYASPQHRAGAKPDPRDDVYSLGMIWYQLLRRDPAAPPPLNTEWALDHQKDGLTDSQARLLAACLDPNPAHRPADGLELADLIDTNVGHITPDGSKNFVLKSSSSTFKPLDAGAIADAQTQATRPPASPARLRKEPDLERSFTNSIGIQFVLIPAGQFVMGSPDHEKGRKEWEGPQHQILITRPFYLSVCPITQAQYAQVTGKTPSCFHRLHGGGPDHPVEQVSWDDAVAFCELMTALPMESEFCRLYRLPSEAEWEYACRAGTTTPYYLGHELTADRAHFLGMGAQSWKHNANFAGKTAKVGSFPANPWGLHDMHGNVLEWCADWWGEDYYDDSAEEDPTGPDDGWQRVARGGSFSQFVSECRSAARLGRAPGTRLNSIGFRVALTALGS